MYATDRLAARRFRVMAAFAIAGVSTVIAASAHMAAGGATPSLVAVALALVVSGSLGMLVVSTRLTRTRTAVAVVLDQLVFHTLFAFFGASGAGTGSTLSTGSAGGLHGGHSNMSLTISDAASASPAAAMIASHLGAAVIAYALLRRGITAITAILVALSTSFARAFAGPATLIPLPVAQRVRAAGELQAPVASEPTRLAAPRGPPMLSVV